MGKNKGNRRVAVAFFAVLTFGAYIGDARHASDQLEGAQVGQDVFVLMTVNVGFFRMTL